MPMKTVFTRNVLHKTKLLLAFAALLPFGSAAENYFVNGMQWELKAFSAPSPSPQSWNVLQYLNGNDFVAGKECLKFYSGIVEENKPVPLLTYIHTDGDKVYFLALKPGEDRDNGVWTLLYDFSLAPGEQTSIGYMTWNDASYNPERSSVITCISEVGARPDSDGNTIMLMSEAMPGTTATPDGDKETNRWIKGIGSVYGVCANGGYYLDGAGSSVLVRATLNGKVLCGSGSAALETPSVGGDGADNATPCYKPDGTRFNPGDKGIYIKDGKKHLAR